ncbi:carboxylesterase/lipase family protein [Pigmentiphaga kullae]|uniref:Carboxylic ester hydrolase n=1 Tax=Pigmentiphaga kullae TaxID=151784 RepID=A0A4Q7NER0_9BURK|nr:carboxylesterase family protein [Pigmentiphaga kullae]RZS81622.1 para-nitrobenzyl esterase [Pigmentiphaga kullae]
MNPNDPSVVDTPYGRLLGAREGKVVRFLGVPYALPPTGSRRFAPPRPLAEGDGRFDATAPAAIPPQLPSRLAKVMGDYPARQDEDCLHLDIWVPVDRPSRAPVFVFLHGGAFMTGGGSLPCYDGAVLAERTGMIVVNVTYRLGALGFLPIPGVAPANLGLRDQMAALSWIRRAIGAFGGDPANVTVAGQSAGAYSIAALQTRADGPELFDRAIMMSTPLGVALQTPAEKREVADMFTRAAGIDTAAPDTLSRLPVDAILKAQLQVLRQTVPASPGEVTPPFMPTVDGEVIAAPPLAAAGAGAWCDTIIGYTREENAAFYVDDAAMRDLPADTVREVYRALHGQAGAERYEQACASRTPGTPIAALMDLRSDLDFIEPTLAYARALAAKGRSPFVYQFDWQSPTPGIGACHCIDLPFLFGNLAVWRDAPMVAGADAAELAGLSRSFQDICAAFAHTGDPNRTTLPPWPGHAQDGAVLHIDRRIQAWYAPR